MRTLITKYDVGMLLFRGITFIIKKNKNGCSIPIKAAEGTAIPPISAPRLGERGGNMVTYSDMFEFVIMLCAIVTLVRSVRNDNHDEQKK